MVGGAGQKHPKMKEKEYAIANVSNLFLIYN